MAAQPAIDIPEYVTIVTPGRSLPALAAEAAQLLADNADLPAPSNLDIWDTGEEVRLGFYHTADTFAALDAWASRFGVTVTAQHTTDSHGQPAVTCDVSFTTGSLHVHAVGWVQADNAA